ncbi:hypothetical protein [Brevibacterium luteolum]|uniref:hypothetical protein n=1 Tax=Brevibacterium luteolum TaxID=199591 RepID=UPI00223C0571|nr:hypothetical protein [Brevibacterium luteolum]MCT1874702.1 hypothetical protein [Brevibacterium luteolum]MCT1891827.1 hypothetical protein [Brevibacterium luteolum]MCT1894352.1 hypothetical protein [Brevibacterium luteolum]MCT1925274.1 hypothetical protein [Brevibacterium luteolum]
MIRPLPATASAPVVSRLAAAALALLLACGMHLMTGAAEAAPAEAAARVSVSGTPNPDGTSTLKLSGRGFQSVQNGFGGIYVLFGVVDGTWQPSKGGKTGTNLRYAYDNESKPEGFQLFVTFPGSSTAHAANGGTLAADGTWSGEIKVPGAKFTSYDRQRNAVDVDCTKEQCGIITIGAHGVVNANNETFTPVEFAAGSGQADEAGGTQQAGQAAEQTQAPAPGEQTARPGGGQAGSGQPVTAPVQPVIEPIMGPEQVDQLNANGTRLVLLLLAASAVALCLIALAVGVGAYLAMKALLLGVNPEALERVRARRAKRAIAAEHRRKRKVFDYRAKQEARTRRREQLAEAKLARSGLDRAATLGIDSPAPAHTADPAAAPDGSAQHEPAPAAGPMRFFDLIGAQPATSHRADGGPLHGHLDGGSAQGHAGVGSVAGRAADTPTLVLDRERLTAPAGAVPPAETRPSSPPEGDQR